MKPIELMLILAAIAALLAAPSPGGTQDGRGWGPKVSGEFAEYR